MVIYQHPDFYDTAEARSLRIITPSSLQKREVDSSVTGQLRIGVYIHKTWRNNRKNRKRIHGSLYNISGRSSAIEATRNEHTVCPQKVRKRRRAERWSATWCLIVMNPCSHGPRCRHASKAFFTYFYYARTHTHSAAPSFRHTSLNVSTQAPDKVRLSDNVRSPQAASP